MTTYARSHHIGVVYRDDWTPENRAVADFAKVGRRDMLCGTACRTGAVMATVAVCRNTGMVKRYT